MSPGAQHALHPAGHIAPVTRTSGDLRQRHEQRETKLVSKNPSKNNKKKKKTGQGRSLGKRRSGTALVLPQGGRVKWDLVSLFHLQFLHRNEKNRRKKITKNVGCRNRAVSKQDAFKAFQEACAGALIPISSFIPSNFLLLPYYLRPYRDRRWWWERLRKLEISGGRRG